MTALAGIRITWETPTGFASTWCFDKEACDAIVEDLIKRGVIQEPPC